MIGKDLEAEGHKVLSCTRVKQLRKTKTSSVSKQAEFEPRTRV
jgi:hypothetical protein